MTDTRIGKRVQLHPATDAWMRGARYGEVLGVSIAKTNFGYQRVLRVKLDTGRVLRVSPYNVQEIF